MDIDSLKDDTRAMWSAGHYPALAERLMPVARELVDACAISAGQEVLDVGAGTGNVAVVAAEAGARVTASDLTPALIEQGRARCEAEGVEVGWIEADVEELPFEDASFDCVTSSFGAMFAPRPHVAASEMFRVVRPGGTVGMANWRPQGFQGRMFALQAQYAPPPPEDLPLPSQWGVEEVVRERLEGLASTVRTEPRYLRWEFESPEGMWQFFSVNAGPAVVARDRLPPDRYEALHQDFLRLVAEWSAGGAQGVVVIEAEYLLVVARKRG